MEITTALVKKLIESQFPQWSGLEIQPVAKSGWDNRTFHLGDEMAVRLPSGPGYAPQAEKEARWLPYLAKNLDLPISKPLGAGKPCEDFPYHWSVNCYLPGQTALEVPLGDNMEFAADLAEFLRKLQAVPTAERVEPDMVESTAAVRDGSQAVAESAPVYETGPAAGLHNFYRGGDLKVYHQETVDALEELKTELPVEIFREIWNQCISSLWEKPGVWIHGDIAPGNILVQNGKLSAMIDFGVMGVGDPACEYAMAWTYFTKECRGVFLEGLDRSLIDRARGWALWKALITYHSENPDVAANAAFTLKNIEDEYHEDTTCK